MTFDQEGHLLLSTFEFFMRAQCDRRTLTNFCLLSGTPHAFPKYEQYCTFTENVAALFGIPVKEMVIRGSGNLGYSIAPRPEKLWRPMRAESDLDLAIVSEKVFDRISSEVKEWEDRNAKAINPLRKEGKKFCRRQEYAPFNCIPDRKSTRLNSSH